MTITEIADLRNEGRLEEALAAAENEFALNANIYTASAVFWCLNEICKQETCIETIASIYQRMQSLHMDYCKGNEHMPKTLESIERRIDHYANELKMAIEMAKDGQPTDAAILKFIDLFKTGALKSSFLPDLGWLIYYNLKHTELKNSNRRKQLLHTYLTLELPRPSVLHSLILNEAIKDKQNTPQQFKIRGFMPLWGWNSFRTEDWKQFTMDNGKTCNSLVERLISVYAQELKTEKGAASNEFSDLIDRALERFPQNQDLPLYKARVLASLGKQEEALNYYKQLILRTPAKYYLWHQASSLVGNIDLKAALLCKAISIEHDESYIGKCRLELANVFIEKRLFSNAKFELDKYREVYESKSWKLKPEYKNLEHLIPQSVIAANNQAIYNEYIPQAESFIYNALPTVFAIKTQDKQLDDRNRLGRKFTQWTLFTKNGPIQLKNPSKFGLDNRMDNGSAFDIRLHNNKIVWISPSSRNPLEQDWIKTCNGIIKLRTDRNGKTYAKIEDAYISERLLKDIDNGDNVQITAIRQQDTRWLAISLTKL